MLAAVFRKFSDVTRVQIKSFLWVNVLLALAFVTAVPLVFGTKNLDSVASSYVLERYISLIGIILLTPLFSPESDKSIAELVESKYTSPAFIYIARLFVSAIVLVIFVSVSIWVMRLGNCEINVAQFSFGTLATALFLGALGFAAFSISKNIVVAYMLPIIIYMLNIFVGNRMKGFYLFSLSQNSLYEKYWLIFSAVLLFLFGVLYRYFERKFQ